MSGEIKYSVTLDTKELEKNSQTAQQQFRNIGSSANVESARIDNAMKRIGTGMAAYFSIQQATKFASSIVNVRGEIESLEISFKTLLGNKQQADELMSQISRYAVSTPMQMNDLAKGAQTLLSFNIEAEKVMPTLKQIGDISMGDSQKFQSLTLAFSQMSSTGKLMGQDLLQMINAGFNPLSVISEQTGKSIGQLKEEMSAGAISADMIADAFASATAEGGKFHNMLQEQSEGVNGSISNLQGSITDMLNDIGSKNQETITTTIQGATTVVQHYREIGEALSVIVATYGTYKAAIIATEAVRGAITTVKHTEEATALYQLLTAEQQELITKQGLSTASAEYYVAVQGEVAANVEAAQATLVKARTEVSAANQIVVARRAEYVAAKELQAQRVKELATIETTGTAKQVEIAQRNLATANTQKETAALAYQSAARDFNTKKTAVETAAKEASTIASAANTAAETANATATGFLATAKARLSVVAAKLNKVIMSNPYAVAAAAVIALGYAIYKLVTYQTDAEKAQQRLTKASKEYDESIAGETANIDILFGRLKNAKEGTESYQKAKDNIISKYGSYLKGLNDEITSLKDVEGAYKAISEAAIQAAKDRAITKGSDEALNVYTESWGKNIKKIQEKFIAKYGKTQGTLLMDSLKESLRTGSEFTSEVQNAINGFTETVIQSMGMYGGTTSYQSNIVDLYVQNIKNAKSTLDYEIAELESTFGTESNNKDGENNVFDATAASLQQLMSKLPEAKKQLEALKSAKEPDNEAITAANTEISQIKEQIAAREKNLTVIKDVKEQIKALQKEQENYGKNDTEYSSLQSRIDALQNKLPSTTSKNDIASEKVSAKQELADKVVEIAQKAMEAEANAQQEGYEKQKAQAKANYQDKLNDIKQQEQDYVDTINKSKGLKDGDKGYVTSLSGYVSQNPGDSNALSVLNSLNSQKVSAQKSYNNEITKINKETADNIADINKSIADRLQTEIQKQRQSINDFYDGLVEKAGDNKEEIAKINEARANELTKFDSEATLKLSPLYQKAFGDIEKYGIKSLTTLREKLKELVDDAEQYTDSDGTIKFKVKFDDGNAADLSQDEFKQWQDKLIDITDVIGAKNPFVALKTAWEDLKSAKATAVSAAKDYTDALESGDEAAIASAKTASESANAAVSAAQNGLVGAIQAVAETLQTASASLQELGEAIGDETVENIGKFANAILSFDTTDPIGNVTSMYKLLTEGAEEYHDAVKEYTSELIDLQLSYNAVLNEQIRTQSEGTSIFYTDYAASIQDAAAAAQDALSNLNEALDGSTLEDFLADLDIKTGVKKKKFLGITIGSSDVYEDLEDAWDKLGLTGEFEDLIDSAGNLNTDLAQTLIDSGLLDEESQEALEALIEYQEEYDEAIEAINDSLEELVGTLSDDLYSALNDAWLDGTDSAEAFFDVVNEGLENLVSQLIYTTVFSDLLDDLQDSLSGAFTTLSGDDLNEALTSIFSDFYTNAEDLVEDYENAMDIASDAASSSGFDWSSISDSDTEADTGAFESMSQDSADELNGRFTAMQALMYTTNSNVQILTDNSASILNHLAGIHTNTDSLPTMQADIATMKSNISDIALKGVKIKK
jgi:tape measure domain-containing protein